MKAPLDRNSLKNITKNLLDIAHNLCYNKYIKRTRTVQKTRKVKIMTKNTLSTLVNYLNEHDIPELAEVKAELTAQVEKNEAKANANRTIYEAAHEVFQGIISDTEQTATELFESTNEWPETFTRSKLQYAITHYWTSEVVRHENGNKPLTYTRA